VEEAKDRVSRLVSARDAHGLHALFDDEMKQAVPLDKVVAFVQELVSHEGRWLKATRTLGETSPVHGTWRVEAERGDLSLEIALDPAHLIAGLTAKPTAAPGPPVARSDVPLSLPVRGEWLVVWGGDTRAVNHHLDAPDQRRAADLVVSGPDQRTFRTDGKSNADYLAYGQDVLAVADGTVETVVDGVPENVPHQENHYVIPGNYVIVRHGSQLFSAYMHLQPGKIRVRPGAKVKRGAVLGLVGNSGHSTEPHLHFQLQDGPDGNRCWGVEPVFERVLVTHEGAKQTVDGYTFLKGDHIQTP
jgi:murein DD-endopeptidase MepM/ murein hydrolase activator NlpD